MDFQYRDPERGFDRSTVKGVVAKLVCVKDPADATALEVAAGGKLYQVVVDTEATAKALLSKGQLRNRVTIVPLNKASPSPSIYACMWPLQTPIQVRPASQQQQQRCNDMLRKSGERNRVLFGRSARR